MPGGIRRFVARGRRMYGTDKPLFENAIRIRPPINTFGDKENWLSGHRNA